MGNSIKSITDGDTQDIILSVIIPSYNSEGYILECLKTVSEQRTTFRFEILVVDSSKQSPEKLIQNDYPEVRVIHLNQRAYPGVARNIGVKNSRGKIIVFTDTDCQVSNGWLQKIFDSFADNNYVVGGAVLNGTSGNIIGTMEYILEFNGFLPEGRSRQVPFIPTCNIAISKHIFTQVGMLEEQIKGSDLSFCKKLTEAGIPIIFDPSIAVTHHNRTRLKQVLRNQKELGIGSGINRKNGGYRGAIFARLPVMILLLPFIRLAAISRRVFIGDKILFLRMILLSPLLIWGLIIYSWGFYQGLRKSSFPDTVLQENDQIKPGLVGIVILNWNGKKDTLACIESIVKQDYADYQIIVVDNGSSDDSVPAIRSAFPQVEVIAIGQNLGFGAGNNVGFKKALEGKAEYILLLNNDTIVDAQMLDRLVSASRRNPMIGIVSPKIYYYDDPRRIWSVGGLDLLGHVIGLRSNTRKPLDHGQYNIDREMDYFLSCAMLIKRELIEKIGMLDPEYFLMTDDFDYSYRARKAGYILWFAHDAIMWHKAGVSTGNKGYSSFMRYFVGRGSVMFMKKHAQWWQWLEFLLVFWLTIIVGFCRELFRGNLKAVTSKIKGFFDGFSGRLELNK